MRNWIVGILVVALVGWAIYDFGIKKDQGRDLDPEEGIEEGDIAPDFELETTDGETVKLSDFRGEKVLLNFWATWCPPCRDEMPDMQDYHEDYDEGVILAVNLLETERNSEEVPAFIDDFGLTFDILLDTETEVASMYEAQGLPTSYFIDSEGKIHKHVLGGVDLDLINQQFKDMP